MTDDDDIPVLTEAVRRRGSAPAQGLPAELVDQICDDLAAEAWVLVDRLLGEALRDVEDRLRVQVNERLGEELPALIERAIRDKLGDPEKHG